MKERVEEIKRLHSLIKNKIEKRLKEFEDLWRRGNEKELFAELAFCLMTPQSKARICWRAVENMVENNVLFEGGKEDMLERMKGVRFKYKKAEYIMEARKMFLENDISIKCLIDDFGNAFQAREWLVKNIKGMGYKEASHFLRNIGKGENIAILDRHILKNLFLMGIIEGIPSSLSKKKYCSIEKRMKMFASEIEIPMNHLDLLLWYKETGEVFK